MNDGPFKCDIVSKTAAEWSSINPFLPVNDLGIESDTGRKKVGVGRRWSETSYDLGVASATITNIVTLTLAEFNALGTKSATTLYIVTG